MNDYLVELEQYKHIQEISDLIEEIQKLREYYFAQNYVAMQQHINNIANKYIVERIVWNTYHPVPTFKPEQQYIIAEEFMYRKSIEILARYNIKLLNNMFQK